ncbi:m-phase inducer phosphatase [Coemansia sp. Benny D115]|nr:m-phase inducer phosphatase [Coemansia sp. Benny D115]
MDTALASDPIMPSSSYLGGLATPNPFVDIAPVTPCKTAPATSRSMATAVNDEVSPACTTPKNSAARSGSASPVGTLVKELTNSLSINRTQQEDIRMKPPPVFEPFKTCNSPLEIRSLSTPMLMRPVRRGRDESTGSPGMPFDPSSPTAEFWRRGKINRARGSLLAESPMARGIVLFQSPLSAKRPAEDEPSESDDEDDLAAQPALGLGSPFASLPRMRPSTTKKLRLDDFAELGSNDTPLRAKSSRFQRTRTQVPRIPIFTPIKEECDLEAVALSDTTLNAQPGRLRRTYSQVPRIPLFLPIKEERDLECVALADTPLSPLATSAAQSSDMLDADFLEMPAPAMAPVVPPSFNPFDESQPHAYLLPCTSASTDSIMRIEAQTANDLLEGVYDGLYDEKIVIDCRFPYEFEGGHIAGASNAPTMQDLEKLLLERPTSSKRTVVILHCEYSLQRAPSMASQLRRRDREVNAHRYPFLHYPEIYVLKGGYRNFFDQFKTQCEPQGYVEMNDQAHVADCRQRMMQFDRQFKRTKSMDAKLFRSNSLHSLTVCNPNGLFDAGSPTAPPMGGRSISSSTLPLRPKRMARTQSARPGVNLIDFSRKL